MKWTTPVLPEEGDTRRRKKFAWFPIQCDDGTTRWLETITIEERWFQSFTDKNCHYWSTQNRKFISKDSK
jgi:hypothetical protein